MPAAVLPKKAKLKTHQDDTLSNFIELSYEEENALPYKEFVLYVRKKQKWEAAEVKREMEEKLKERKCVEELAKKEREKKRREEERRRKEKQRKDEEEREKAEKRLKEQEQNRQKEERRKREERRNREEKSDESQREDRGKRENTAVVMVPCRPFWVNDGRPVPYFPETVPGVAIPKIHNTPEIPYLEENTGTSSSLQKEICAKQTHEHQVFRSHIFVKGVSYICQQYKVQENGRIYFNKDSWLPDRQRCKHCIETKTLCWRRVQAHRQEYRVCLACKFSRRKCCRPSQKLESTEGGNQRGAKVARNRAKPLKQTTRLRQPPASEIEDEEEDSRPAPKRRKVDNDHNRETRHEEMEEKFWRVMLANRGIDPSILDKNSRAFDKAVAEVYRESGSM